MNIRIWTRHRNKKAVSLLVSSILLLSLAGCGNGGDSRQTVEPVRTTNAGLSVEKGNKAVLSDFVTAEQVTEEKTDEQAMQTLSDAAMRLLYENIRQDGAENVLISPASILFALGMTENGADGTTLSEMEQVVNGGIGLDTLNPLMYSMNQRLEREENVSWNVADSIWIRNDGKVIVNEDFVKDAVSYYDADVILAPFDDTTASDINAWVNKNTNGMIPSQIDKIPEDAGMYLINAMAFEGEWSKEYQDDQIMENAEFQNADGSTSVVTMLSSEESRYFYLGDGVGFLKPYKGGRYSFIGILPPETEGLEDYMEEIVSDESRARKLSVAIQNAGSDKEVQVQIPEFALDYEVEMSKMLAGMGMPTAFTETADFSRMVTEDSEELYMGDVLHKTHIEVDRKGTRAAAATSVTMVMKSAGPDSQLCIYLDRPFIYGIVDNVTGYPIFLGCVNTME